MSLDAHKPADPRLERLFKQYLDAIAFASDGRTTSFGDKLTGGHEHGPPASPALQDTRHWLREWSQRKTDRERLLLLKELKQAVIRLQYAPDNSTQPGTLEWRRKIAFDERDKDIVCETYGISRATYYRIRGSLNLTRPRRR